jgi:hypothetical protein
VGKVVSFKKPIIIRCNSCNKLKPEIQEKFSHRGIEYTGVKQAHSWIVYQSGWKRVEVLPLKKSHDKKEKHKKIYYHCPDCRSL